MLLRLRIEAPQLALPLLPRLLQFDIRLRAARAVVVGRLCGRWLDALPVVQLLLPLLLIDLELPCLLLLARVGGSGLRGALLLLHAQLESILLLLPLQLVLLQRPRARVVGACRRCGETRTADRHR
jgi:hypothetical protein